MFPTVRVDSRKAESLEQLGAKRKFWLTDDGQRRLLKLEERGTGEDWAEKLACEFCEILGLPHAHYDLALDVATDTPGVVCPTLATPGWTLGLGNQMLGALDPDYPEGTKYKVSAHTPEAVANVLRLLNPPPEPYSDRMPAGIKTALDVFTGYVMFDVWVGNQDRHHENWGVLRKAGSLHSDNLYLAPSFDHGAAMARQLTDEERHRRMTSKDRGYQVAAFAQKARSAFYATAADTKAMTTYAAWQTFATMAPEASALWLERLRGIDGTVLDNLVTSVPTQRMTAVCRSFTLSLLNENRARLMIGKE